MSPTIKIIIAGYVLVCALMFVGFSAAGQHAGILTFGIGGFLGLAVYAMIWDIRRQFYKKGAK